MSARNSEETKERILNEALKIFARKGFDATTTREICEKANININLIYYYFGGKKELYIALMDRVIKKQAELMDKHLNMSCNIDNLTYEKKIALLINYVDVMVDFLYNNISKEQVSFFLQIQQSNTEFPSPPAGYVFAAKLLSSILDKEISSKEVVFDLLFLTSQIAFPRIVPLFSLKILGQDNFDETDIKIIKKHIYLYIDSYYLKGKK